MISPVDQLLKETVGTILAEEVGSIMRDYKGDPPTFSQWWSQALLDVHFTVDTGMTRCPSLLRGSDTTISRELSRD